ncbi:MAG: group I truncated hemoglobin [Methyloligellaceae bacterium]
MKISLRSLAIASVLPITLAISIPLSYADPEVSAEATLYERLGGYNAIAAVVDDVFPRLAGDEKLKRFWQHRGKDGIAREKQLLIDFFAEKSGGPLYYTGRDMKVLHEGMKINNTDWKILIKAVNQTLDKFELPTKERDDLMEFIESTKKDIVELS